MLVWLLVLVAVLLVTPALFALARLAKHLNRQKPRGFARRPAPDPAAVDAPPSLSRHLSGHWTKQTPEIDKEPESSPKIKKIGI